MARHVDDDRFGRLFVPRDHNRPVRDGKAWAADNGAYSGFDAGVFVAMLERLREEPGCLFVVAPDVVGDSTATDALFGTWEPIVHGLGFPVAYVLQDGCSSVPWSSCDAVFVGGTTEWKLSRAVAGHVGHAQARGKWAHMGRVNSKRRVRHALDIGIDSIDGTLFSRWPDDGFQRYIEWDAELQERPRLCGF